MYNIKNYEYDCTRKCHLEEHGNKITAALTKRSVNDEQLAAYIAKCCCNFCDIVDSLGRSAVHLASSVGRYEILEWLLNNGAIINGCDYESGSSPLHRALYYGNIDCAVLLLRYGASLDILDKDTRSTLQNICRIPYAATLTMNDILVWGSNNNYNLGTGNDQTAELPQSIDFFRKENIYILQVALGTYHTLFLDSKMNLYAVGHGQGGRCGVANANSLPEPRKVKIQLNRDDEHIIHVSASLKHSLVLTNHSSVYACGLNENYQLGIREYVEQLTTFREVVTIRDYCIKNLIEVIALDQHSIAYSKKAVLFWGTNLGQMGESIESKPHSQLPVRLRLPHNTQIVLLKATNTATALYTDDNNILLYNNEKMKKIRTPQYEVLKSILLDGGDNIALRKGSAAGVRILVLTLTNVLYMWYEKTQMYLRCIFENIRLPQMEKILLRHNQMYIMSEGNVYSCKWNQMTVPRIKYQYPKLCYDSWQEGDYNRAEISKTAVVRVQLNRLPQLDRVVDIFINDSFTSFAVLQESHFKYLQKPKIGKVEYNFRKLYDDVCKADTIHDVVLHVGDTSFPAHKLILFARAPGLKKIIKNSTDKHVDLNYQHLTPRMVELMLKHIYTNNLPTTDDIDYIEQSLVSTSPKTKAGVCALFCGQVERFQLNELAVYLSSYINDTFDYVPAKSIFYFKHLRRTSYPELHDVRIICESGNELHAHKCVLVARLEYFERMFVNQWAENSTINLSTISIEYVEPIIDYLYSLDVDHFRKQNYSESFLYNMIIYCDQFFIKRLQEVCELLILDKMTIRKCGEILEFALKYNTELLKKSCLDFICQNLARVLSHGSIENCDTETLKTVNKHYRDMFEDSFQYRTITPDSTAVDDATLLSFIADFTVNLDYRMEEENEQKTPQKQKETKTQPDVRSYERDAISSMMKQLNLDNQLQSLSSVAAAAGNPQAVQETEKLSFKEANAWSKVVDKKEQKRKFMDNNGALKEDNPETKNSSFETLKSSELSQSPEKYSPLLSSSPSPSCSSVEVATPVSKRYAVDLSQLVPQNQKLSQKQRKRQGQDMSWRSSPENLSTAPVAIPSAWGAVPRSPSSSGIMAPAPTGSANDPTSYARMIRNISNAEIASRPQTTNEEPRGISEIVAAQRLERDRNIRLQNRSLAMTQIEEAAISELRTFYNADNIGDENIIIERKTSPWAPNFCSWEKR